MALHPTLPSYYTPTLVASGLANIHGGIRHKQSPPNYQLNVDLYKTTVYPANTPPLRFVYNEFTKLKITPALKSDVIADTLPTTHTLFFIHPPIEGPTNKPPNNTPPINYTGFIYFTPKHNIKQIYQYGDYSYVVSNSDIESYNIKTGEQLSKQSLDRVGTSIYATQNNVYVGTQEGILKTTSNGGMLGNLQLLDVDITNSGINDIKGYDNCLWVTTQSGIDFIDLNSNKHSYTYYHQTDKCWMSSTTGYVLIKENPNYINLYRSFSHPLKECYRYTAGSGILDSVIINDITATNATTNTTADTLFCATNSGIYIIDTYTNTVKTLTNMNFKSIWCITTSTIDDSIIFAVTETKAYIITSLGSSLDIQEVDVGEVDSMVDMTGINTTHDP